MSEQTLSDSTGAMSLSTDAIPMSPRQSHEGINQPVTQEQNEQIPFERTNRTTEENPAESFENIPDPPTDWGFNIFLNNIAESLSAEDLSTMKWFFEGEGGIGKGVLEKIKSPQDLFRILRTRGYISRDNLLYLQGILYWARRRDLIQDAVEYCETVGEALHFYAPSYQPENGYKYIKFHIAGKTFKSYIRKDLELLRNKVSKLLFVPEKFIIISGIEPSSSLVITLMIPEMYVEILQDLLEEDNGRCVSLQDNGVDLVEIAGKPVHSIKGTNEGVLVDTEQQLKLVNVYEQLQHTKARLDNSEISCIDLARQIDILQSKIDTTEEKLGKAEDELRYLKLVLSITRDETQPASLKELSSLKEFTEALHQISIVTVDKKVVQKMLDSTVNIVSTRMRESHKIQEQNLLLGLQNMQSQLVPLMFELERYKFFASLSSIDKSVLDGLQTLLQPFIAQTQISLTPHGLQMLTKISSKLRHKEKEKLKQKYKWNADGEIEKSMAKDPNVFLAGLFYKEVETKQENVHCETFIAQCLSEIGRDDLKKFLEPKGYPNPASPRNFTEARQKSDPPQNQNSQQQQRQQSQQQTQRQEQTQRQQPQPQQQYHDQSPVITRMAQQIQEMYNILQTKQNSYASKFDDWKTPTFPFAPQAFQHKQSV